MPRRMWGIRSEDAGVDLELGGLLIDVECGADHHVSEVEGPDRRRVDHDEGERLAVVGAGKVDAPVRVGQGRADAVAGFDMPDLAGRGT